MKQANQDRGTLLLALYQRMNILDCSSIVNER
jgi:hypothetical protein